jgi:hypothetical protein
MLTLAIRQAVMHQIARAELLFASEIVFRGVSDEGAIQVVV